MKNISNDSIKEIAEQLDSDFRVFVHKATGELIFVPDDTDFDIEFDTWDEDFDALQQNPEQYCEIEKWTTNEAFEIMNDFAEALEDTNLKNRLLRALQKNRPFTEFRSVIDSAGDFRPQWFRFRDQRQQDFVARQLDLLTQTNN